MSDTSAGERLQKVLAAAGVASRRQAEILMLSGRVRVNGVVADTLGLRVHPSTDLVELDGTPLNLDPERHYFMLNKPVGMVSSLDDERERQDLSGVARDIGIRVFHVGRLDADTSGLLLLTNDGEAAQVLSHPSFGVSKRYVATVAGRVTPATARRLEQGVELDDGPIAADRVTLKASGESSLVELVLHSGRNRVVRRMLAAVGHPVTALVRRGFGPLQLGTLKVGQWRELDPREQGALLTLVRAGKGAK